MPLNDSMTVPMGDTMGAPADDMNPIIRAELEGKRTRFRATVSGAVAANPDEVARQNQIASYLDQPRGVVAVNPQEAERSAAIKRVTDDSAVSPVLQLKYSDADFAKLAHDDSGPLSAIASAAKWLVNAPDAPAGGSIQTVRALASGAPRLASGLWGAAAAVGGIGDQITQSIDDAAAFVTNTPRRQIVGTTGPETFFLAQQKTAQNTAANVMGMSKDAGFVEKAAMSGLQSAGQSLLLAPLGLAQSAGNASINALLGVMGVSTGGESYGKARAAGVSPFQAAAYGIEDAVAEVVTEKYLGIAGFLKNVKAGASAAKLFGYEVVKEVPGEIGATLWQNFNEWMNVNPGKPIVDFVSEQPAAIAETIIATLVGGGAQIGVVRGIDRLIDPDQTERKGQQAEQHASVLEAMQTTMQASKLLERSPETLTSYAQDLVDEGTPNVYLDSAKLVEAGVDLQALAQVMPSLASQLDQAQSGADLVVPTGEFLAGSLTESGSAFSQALVEHARTDASGMSRADAKVYMAEKGDKLNAEIEQVLKEHENDAEFKAGRDQVQAELLTQLNAVKRFTPAVNTQYATLAANFYAVMAARSGMSVPQFAQTYQLGFSGQTQAGAQVLGQPAMSTSEVVAGIESKYPDLKLDVGGSDNTISVSRIVLPQDQRGQGVGTEVMNELAAHADATGKTLTLSPSKDFGGSVPRLKSFYKSLGFVENKGKNKDLAISDSMYRKPQAVVADAANQSPLQTDTAAFKKWFGDSKVVDAEGKPLVVYHGRENVEGLDTFDVSERQGYKRMQVGAYFSADKAYAASYPRGDGNPTVAAYLSIQNPYIANSYAEITQVDQARKDELQALGHDGVIFNDEVDGAFHEILVFEPTQIKSAIGNNGNFDGTNPNILNQSPLQTETPAFKRWSNDAPLVDGASAETHEFKTGEKVVLEAYHGTARPDRVGTVFQKKRATSGPMAFFTSNPELASSYAKGKADTSLANEDQDYANWFKFKPQGQRSSIDLVRAWYVLTTEQKTKISELAPRVTYGEDQNEDGSNAIVLGDEGRTNGTGSYDYNLQQTQRGYDKQGNPLKALVEDWLNSGNLFNDEEQFMKVLQLAGFPVKDITYDSPHSAFPFVYKTYIEMQNPLVTSDVPQAVIDALKAAAKKDRSRAASGGADMWDKNTRTLKEWVANYTDLANASAAFVWTSIPDKVTDIFKAMGYDGIVDWSGKGGGAIVSPVYIPFAETQVKSAIGNKGKFDSSKKDILKQDQRGQIAFANDITQQASIISMFKAADLSTFIHEGGHFFLEVQADLAAKISARISQGETVTDGERSIVDDMNKTLDWMGVKGSPELSAIDTWYLMTADEKRPHHEQWARGFEAYAFEGKSPSIELATMFQTFRSWLVNVYRSVLKSVNAGPADISQAMNVELSDEVRAVMDRMLATSDQIEASEAARNMGPLFSSAEEAGMDLEAYKLYHDMGTQATMNAVDELQAKGLKDMQWLSRARSRTLKSLQKQHNALRAQIAREVRAEVMSQPIYRAWTFLTAKAGDQLKGDKPVGQAKGVNPAVDNLFTAIAKLGGLNRAEVKSQWGIDEKEKLESGVFGSPVVRKEGGRSMDAMAEYLVEEGYIIEGRNDQTSMEQLQELFDDQRRGVDRYSITHDMEAAYGDQPLDTPKLSDMGFGKLRTQDLRDMYGTADDAIWRKLSELRMTSDETGLNPEIVAELFDFQSADELVKKLLAAEPPKSAIEGRTDQRMLEEHGDLATPAGLERAADMAIHNDARVRFVAAELRALQHAMAVREKQPGKKNTVDVLTAAAKEYGNTVIARLKVRDIRPAQYAAAEVRAGKAAAAAKGDVPKQAEHKRNQLVNMYATKAAYAAQEEVKKAIKYFKKFDTTSKTLDPDYQGQIEVLLERFDLRASTTQKALDKRKSLAEWVDNQAKLGLEADIPAELMDEANRKSFKDMTVEEVRGLRDTIKQIEYLGRLKRRLLTAKDKRDFDVIVAEAGASIIDNGGAQRPVELEEAKGVKPWLEGFAAGHRKLASLFRQMDGNKDAGPLWRILGRTMNAAGTAEAVMIEQSTVRLTEMYAPLLKLKGGVHGDKRYIPAIDASLTRGARLSVALNWGNATNRQRVMAGDNWSESQVRAILQTLSPVELKFVNEAWAYINTFWPQIAEKQKRVSGLVPEKVEGSPFSTTASDGSTVQMNGGYYPIKYDSNRDDRAEKLDAAAIATDMLRGAMTRATTRRGHTKARVEDVKRPVKKTLDVITQHISEVVHDLAWHEWLIDANRLLDAKPINDAIRNHYGKYVLRTMKDGLQSIATADMVPQTKMDQALLHLRGNISRSTMGFSLTTAFMQPFGLAQSVVRIGPRHVLQGLKRWGGDAVRFESSNTWISEKSDFMRLRSTTFNRELREIRGRVSQGHSRSRQIYDASLFILMQKMQMVADVPTWIGAYEKALAGGQDEATAVALADQSVVDSQGGGQTQDLAELQRKHPMLSMFYSYFNTTYNLAAESTGATDFKNPLAIAGWLADMMMLMVIPAIGPALILDLMRSGGGDDDDTETWMKKLLEWQGGYLLGTVMGLREASGMLSGFDYSGPPVGRVVGDIGKFGKQVGQGEADEAAAMASVRLMGSATGIPTVQILRSYRGWQAWSNGEAPPTAMLLGPPPRD